MGCSEYDNVMQPMLSAGATIHDGVIETVHGQGEVVGMYG